MSAELNVEALRVAAAPLMAVLPAAAWLPHLLNKAPAEGARTNAPATWRTLDAALDLVSLPHVTGVGFAICPGIISLDFDHCRDPVTRELTPLVADELDRFASFAYGTPSGTGIRIVGLNGSNITGGKSVRVLRDGTRVEIFIGPTNFYNTFTSDMFPGHDRLVDISDLTLDYLMGLPPPGVAHTGNGTDRSGPGGPLGGGGGRGGSGGGDPTASIEDVVAALKVIPNPTQNWDFWSYIGMTVFRSTSGSEEGLRAWMTWSAKHPCHEDAACEERWRHWFRSPPNRLGFGTLYHWARQASPLFVPPRFIPRIEGAAEAGKAEEKPAARLLHLQEVEDMQPPGWLIEGVLPAQGLAVLYGAPKSGKTFVALAQALHIAWGQPWAGRPVQRGGVVYIAGEGVHGMGDRLKAARTQFGIPRDIPFWMHRGALDFTDPKLPETLVAMVREVVPAGEAVALVIIDTLARSMPGADENSARDVGLVIATAGRVQVLLSCAVLAIHHQGKDEERGMRGTSALRGAVDASFRVVAHEDAPRVTLINEDQKDAETSGDMVFDMVSVPVPGSIGRSSLVPVLAPEEVAGSGQEAAGGGRRAEPKGMAKRALEILVDVIAGPEGAILPPLEGLPANGTLRGVSLEVYRREYHARNPERDHETRRKALRRAIDDLIQMRRVDTRDIWIWLVT